MTQSNYDYYTARATYVGRTTTSKAMIVIIIIINNNIIILNNIFIIIYSVHLRTYDVPCTYRTTYDDTNAIRILFPYRAELEE